MANSFKKPTDLLRSARQNIIPRKGTSTVGRSAIVLMIMVLAITLLFSACSGKKTTPSESEEIVPPSYEETTKKPRETTVKPKPTPAPTTKSTTVAVTETEQDSTTATQPATISTTAAPTTAAPTTTVAPTPVPTPTPTPEPGHTVRVIIPEGFNMIQIIDRLASAGVNTKDALMSSAVNDDFSSFEVIRSAGMPTGRCWQLEGYLFPDTYEFYKNESPKSVWSRFLRNFEANTSALRPQLARFGWTMDNAVVFASLLEKEAGNPNEIAKVSSVMHNRLNSGMRLDLDASILYVEYYIKHYISGDINRFNSYYNTYKTPALPAGAISNPGLRAFNASLNPASTDYYYFATDSQEPPVYYYSRTLEEHEALILEKNIG